MFIVHKVSNIKKIYAKLNIKIKSQNSRFHKKSTIVKPKKAEKDFFANKLLLII